MDQIGEWDFKEQKYLRPLSLSEKAGIATFIATLPPRLAWWTVCYLRSRFERGTLTETLFVDLMRVGFDSLSVNQIRAVIPTVPMRQMLSSFPTLKLVKTDKLRNYNSIFQVENASARWIHETRDRSANDPVILFLHGGAFFLKMSPTQVLWCVYLTRKLRPHRFSCLALDYTITPWARYPSQLEEALAVYNELSKTANRIIIIGDSAGGNLTAALCASVRENRRPNPSAVIMISPWVELRGESAGSFRENAKYDYIHHAAVNKCATMYATKEQIRNDPKVSMISGSREYWRDNVFPRDTLVVWGGRETLKDSICRFVELAGIEETFEEVSGIHDVTVTGPHTEGTKVVIEYLRRWFPTAKL